MTQTGQAALALGSDHSAVDEPGPDAGELYVGDCARLTRDLGPAQVGAAGRVIGFFRRESLTIVVKLAAGEVVEVRPEDLERLT